MIDFCSIKTYHELVDEGYFGKRQAIVLDVFMNYNSLTGAELAQILEKKFGKISKSETIRNRVTELTDMGILKKENKRKCSITGRLVNVWKWTGRLEPVKDYMKKVPCEHCCGRGYTKVYRY